MSPPQRQRNRRQLWWIALPVGAYLLVGWLFSFTSEVEGLVTPAGNPNLEVVATGAAFLVLRLIVRSGLPSVTGFLIAAAAQRRWLAWRNARAQAARGIAVKPG